MSTRARISGSLEDKAGKQHWDEIWSSVPLPPPIDPQRPGLDHHHPRTIFKALLRALDAFQTRGAKLLEVGCAQSAWLPVFAREFGFEISGLDYSELGCKRARQLLERDGVSGEVYCADMFSPPAHLLRSFDCVVSFGVIEHFRDTASVLAMLATYLKPGGRLVTLIPNMRGLCGAVQRVVNRPVYEMHVPLSRKELVRAHAIAGLGVRWSSYVMGGNLCVVNMENLRQRPHLYDVANRWQWRISKGFWALESLAPFPIHNSATSPYIICVADR
jgi:2-polyprenyl-3-methyl-5-hydroxy-6-metoxy-1,4-benzoquinol methylase